MNLGVQRMTEFLLVRISMLGGENHSFISSGYVNETPIVRDRNFFRLLEVFGRTGFTMVNFDAEAIFGREMYFFMLQRTASAADVPLEAVVREAAGV